MKMVCLARFLLILLGIIGLSLIPVTAQADMIYTGTNFDIEVSTAVDLEESPSLMAVTLTAIGKGGVLPVTFDSTFSGTGGTGITTVGNSLHQVWRGDGSQTWHRTPMVEVGYDLLDTHFLDTTPMTITQSPEENKLVSNLETGDIYDGFGNHLVGAFAIQDVPANLQPTWDFAYIVVPSGTKVILNFELLGVDLEGDGYSDKVGGIPGSADVDTIFFTVVPEPSMLLLLAMGALGLLVKGW